MSTPITVANAGVDDGFGGAVEWGGLVASRLEAEMRQSGTCTAASLEVAKKHLDKWRSAISTPVAPLPSMTRAQEHIQHLRDLTRQLVSVLPGGGGTGGAWRERGGIASSVPSLLGGMKGTPRVSRNAPQKDEPIIPDDKEAFLQQLHRNAVPDDDLRERYERMQAFEGVKSLHLSFQSTPPTGDYKSLLQAKTDGFASNMDRVEKLSALTPRSLARHKRLVGAAGNGGGATVGGGDDAVDDDPARTARGGGDTSSRGLRAVASSLADTDTSALLEKTIVLQTSKQEFQGNLSMKRAVQLAMAAQHAQQLEDMKRTFEQRLHEAVGAAKNEGLVVGRKEGSEFAHAQLEQQTAKIAELNATVARLSKLAAATYAQKEATLSKVNFVRDERERWQNFAQKFEDVDADELLRRVQMYEEERDFLYKKAFRTDAEMESIVFKSPKRHHIFAGATAAGGAGDDDARPGAGVAFASSTASSPRAKLVMHRRPSVEARKFAKRRESVLIRLHENLSRAFMAQFDVDAGTTRATLVPPEAHLP